MNEAAIYIHIPFCDHKCIYCDFYSIITQDNIAPFLTSVKKEISNYSKIYNNRKFTSIFFGGGTPSLMKTDSINEIITALRENYNVHEDAEVTLETNPGTVDKDKLQSFRKVGINRISIGIQSFNNDELKFLTRIHDKETAIRTVHNAFIAGFENISVDLIFNLPGQSKEKWINNLKTAVKLPLKHISVYSLILERGTILNKMVLDGKIKLQDEDYDAELYEAAIDFLLDNEFLQYEVSNFAKKNFECRHNNAYWRYREYLSFGPSAHSFMDNKRWWNFSSLKKYISEIEKNNFADAGFEIITDQQMFREYIMLALRSKGIDLVDFTKNFGSNWIEEKHDYFEELRKNHFLSIENNFIKLTKSGYAVCDEILNNLL
jgi:oxygen-independent coproporphyrinogen-3 oxidase